MTSETRYFRSDKTLSATESSGSGSATDDSGNALGYLGIKVYVSGTLISGSACVAVSAQFGLNWSYQTGTWNCPAQSIAGQIKVEFYSCDSTGASYQLKLVTFLTSESNIQLSAATWTVRYGGQYDINTDLYEGFEYGKLANYYDSYISNFTYVFVGGTVFVRVPTITNNRSATVYINAAVKLLHSLLKLPMRPLSLLLYKI